MEERFYSIGRQSLAEEAALSI